MDERKNMNESSLSEENQLSEEASVSEFSEQLPEEEPDLQQSSERQQGDTQTWMMRLVLFIVFVAIAVGIIVSVAESSKQAEEDALAASAAAEISAELEKVREEFVPSEPPYTQENIDALTYALDLLDAEPLSRSALIDRLREDGFSSDDAYWAADHCGDVWNEQAFRIALAYMRGTDFTSEEIAAILIDEKEFTKTEAIRGVAKAEVEIEQGG